MINKILNEDCLEGMKRIPDGSIDMVLCDMPYGTTQYKWDTIIDLDLMWEQLKRISTHTTPIVLTSTQPFTSKLVISNLKCFKHEWIWEKNHGCNFACLKYQPMKDHEIISVFGFGTINYFPIKEERNGNFLKVPIFY